jgi:GT2 family glycosyltransferase/glycosyltransferase involved in cell wall biosynthesis
MKSNSLPAQSSTKHQAELFQLIKLFSDAKQAGDRTSALRYIDRAWRMSSTSPEINYLYGQLKLADGGFEQAVQLLGAAAAARLNPDYDAAYILALLEDRQIEQACKRLESALIRFAVTPDGALARAARKILTATAPRYPGWIAIGPDLTLHGDVVGKIGHAQLSIRIASTNPMLQSIQSDGRQSYVSFTGPSVRGMSSGTLTACMDGVGLLGGNLAVPPAFALDSRITESNGNLTGWVSLGWDPDRSPEVTLYDDNGVLSKTSTRSDSTWPDRHFFSFDLKAHKAHSNSLYVSAEMPNGTLAALPDSPFLITPKPAPKLPHPMPTAGTGRIARNENKPARRKIDVIIIPRLTSPPPPLACIRSVLDTVDASVEIIVIDDTSRDPEITTLLKTSTKTGAITVLRESETVGSSEALNRALRLHDDRDVVLLTGDIVFFGDWLARLQTAAYSTSKIATVTPLTNARPAATSPVSRFDLSEDAAAHCDRLAAVRNKGMTVDIPTANGFCLYIRRDCIAEIGYFDSETFASVEGGKSDFCERAVRAGWRHVLAADTYVWRMEESAPASPRLAVAECNARLLELRYPGYQDKLRDFANRDPTRLARRQLDEARLVDGGAQYVLYLGHALGGGAERALQDRAKKIRAKSIHSIILRPDSLVKNLCNLEVDQAGFDDLYYDIPGDLAQLVAFLNRLNILSLELHHFLDLPSGLVERLFDLGLPIDIKIHDYVWYCPRVNLLNGESRYCGEPNAAACEACITKNGSYLTDKVSVAVLRARSTRWLERARSVTAPTRTVAARMRARFPAVTFQVEPLEPTIEPTPIARAAKNKIKVAIIGALMENKGLLILLEMARHAANWDLPLDFVLIGFTEDDTALMKTGKVFVTGKYAEAEVAGLIARENPDLALFLSQFPETWCYALTHALHAKVPIAAFDHGAIAERLRASSATPLLFPLSTTPAEICDHLLSAFQIAPRRQNSVALASKTRDVNDLPRAAEAGAQTHQSSELAKILRSNMAEKPDVFSAAVEFLPLPVGLYVFSVRSTSPSQRTGGQTAIALPALQVGVGPGAPAGQVEFMAGPQTSGGWLCEPHDQIVVKIKDSSAVLLLTSIMAPGMTPLEIGVQRLDRDAADDLGQKTSSRPLPVPSTQKSIPLRVTPHIRNRGDIPFTDSQWAGFVGEQLWIESFSILPLEGLASEMIEYKGVTATGVETPWVSGGGSCGTRGILVPLIGFAVRINPRAKATSLLCEYGAILASGTYIGPFSDGASCRSPDAADPIEAIWVSISHGDSETAKPAGIAPPTDKEPIDDAKRLADAAPQTEASSQENAKKRKSRVGPRFSVFREAVEPEQK